MPLENRCPSVKACFGSWQEAQATVLSAETRLSKYRSQPSSAFWGVYGLSFGQKIGTSPSGILGPSLGNGGISSPAAERSPAAARQTRATSPADGTWGRVGAVMGCLYSAGAAGRARRPRNT